MQENENKELSLEESFEEIEKVLTKLESKETTLEDSFREYQKGMQLVKACAETIDRVEKKMLLINERGEYSEF